MSARVAFAWCGTILSMTLRTKRLGSSKAEPHCLEVENDIAPASALLWHLNRLPGLRVIAKKSWALTDDFEAYFLYQGRLFVVQTPFARVWVSMLGQPANESLFVEIEEQVRSFRSWTYLLAPAALVRYFVLPSNPPHDLLAAHEGVHQTSV